MGNANWDADLASDIIGARVNEPGPLLPILHALQHAFGWIFEEAIPLIAGALNLGRAEIHGVVSFYHDFRSRPAGRHVLKLCRAEACQAAGGDAMADRFIQQLGTGWGETTPDGALTVEPVFCLGLCATAPAALIDGRPFGRLTPAKLDSLVETC